MHIAVGVVWYKTSARDRLLFARSLEAAVAHVAHDNSFSFLQIDNTEAAVCGYEEAHEECKDVVTRSIPSRGNIGFGAAHNQLMEAAFSDAAELYIGMNPDGRCHRMSLVKLLPRVLAEPGNLYEMRQFPTEHPKYYAPDTGETLWASGAAFCLSKDAWQAIGGFDERFFMYCEDVDLSWRFRLDGRKCITVSDSLFYHNTANRRASEGIEQRFLLSGRILGKKYGITNLVERCESALIVRGVPLPDTKIVQELPHEREDEFQNSIYFGDDFSFSPIRWSA